MVMPHPIPVTIITGSLGSGKTTLLRELLKQPLFSGAVVIVNEAGAIGLDKLLLEHTSQPVLELVNGCFCCVSRSSFIDTLKILLFDQAASRIPQFDRVVVETSGLVDPTVLLRDIVTSAVISRRFVADRVITVVDGLNGMSILNDFPEAMTQIAVADRIVVSKTDLIDGVQDSLFALISDVNPGVSIVRASFGQINACALLDEHQFPLTTQAIRILNKSMSARAHSAKYTSRHHWPVETFYVLLEDPLSGDTITRLFNALSVFGSKLLRVKGLINVREQSGRPALIHGVHGFYHPVEWLRHWPSDDHRTRIVFITRGVAQDEIEQLLRKTSVFSKEQSCETLISSFAAAMS